MKKVLVIGANNVRRMLRDRTNLFFVFLLPTLIILVIGSVFGGGFTPRVGVVSVDSGQLGEALVADIAAEEALEVTTYRQRQSVLDALQRDDLEAGVIVPPGYDGTLRSGQGAAVEYLAVPDGGGFDIQSLVEAKLAAQAAEVGAAHFAAGVGETDFGAGLAAAATAAALVPQVVVATVGAGGESLETALGQFDLGAAQQLVLFVFITSLTASTSLIQSRRLGVSRRELSTPTASSTVILGETTGRFLVAMLQGIFIVVVAALLFGVRWGPWPAALALVVAFALVGTGAGMLMGSLFSNDSQAGGVAVFLALGLGALGGCMVPLEVFSDTMRRVAHLTPHAWALDGFSETIRRGGGLEAITTELAVLVAFAAVLLAVAVAAFRRSLTV